MAIGIIIGMPIIGDTIIFMDQVGVLDGTVGTAQVGILVGIVGMVTVMAVDFMVDITIIGTATIGTTDITTITTPIQVEEEALLLMAIQQEETEIIQIHPTMVEEEVIPIPIQPPEITITEAHVLTQTVQLEIIPHRITSIIIQLEIALHHLQLILPQEQSEQNLIQHEPTPLVLLQIPIMGEEVVQVVEDHQAEEDHQVEEEDKSIII